MSGASVRLPLTRECHNDNSRLKPSLALDASHLTIEFGARGRVRVLASSWDLRRLAKKMVVLADAVDVANGDKRVEP